MNLTKRTHSNPCFWTAFWNKDYYEKAFEGKKDATARMQKVYSLNVRADKIVYTAVENVHSDKKLGISKITPEAVKDFCKRYFPEEYEQFAREMESHPEILYLDFENIWTRMEKDTPYQTLLSVIKKQKIDTKEEKLNISCFIIFQHIRSHAVLNSMMELAEQIGMPRFEYYWSLKNMLSNPDFLFKIVTPFLFSQWILYVTSEHTFPLPDTPIFVKNGNVMVALSPRMLLEINLKTYASESSWVRKDGIPKSKLNEYRSRCISNTFKEIIFSDENLLEGWRMHPEFRHRIKLLSQQKSFNSLIRLEGTRELWKINAFGNFKAPGSAKRRRSK